MQNAPKRCEVCKMHRPGETRQLSNAKSEARKDRTSEWTNVLGCGLIIQEIGNRWDSEIECFQFPPPFVFLLLFEEQNDQQTR